MAEDNVKAQMRKGILEYCILAILSREDSYAPKIKAANTSQRSTKPGMNSSDRSNSSVTEKTIKPPKKIKP